MKSEDNWKPSKYVWKSGRLQASRDAAQVHVGSRLSGDVVAEFYQMKLPLYASGRLADLGCGSVPLYAVYRDHASDIVCLDWSAPEKAEDHLDYRCDLAGKLPLARAEFNTLVLSDVLEHIANPEMLWGEMSRILAPGGYLIMNSPFLYCLHEQPHDYYRYSAHALRRFAEANGFEVVELEPLGGSPEVMTDMLSKHLQFVPIVGRLLAAALQAVTGWTRRTRPGRSFSRRTADAFPLGYGMVARRLPDEVTGSKASPSDSDNAD